MKRLKLSSKKPQPAPQAAEPTAPVQIDSRKTLIASLRENCDAMLQSRQQSHKTNSGRASIIAFYQGAIAALVSAEIDVPPIIVIRLLSGRYDELTS